MQDLTLRLTNRYVGTWAHLDDWESIGAFDTRHQSSQILDEDDPCEPTRTVMVMEIDCPRSDDEIYRALRDTLGRHGCDHEHDCCGCWSTRLEEARPEGGRTWTAILHSSRNY